SRTFECLLQGYGIGCFRKVLDRYLPLSQCLKYQGPVALTFGAGQLNLAVYYLRRMRKAYAFGSHYASIDGFSFMITFCFRIDSLWINSSNLTVNSLSNFKAPAMVVRFWII